MTDGKAIFDRIIGVLAEKGLKRLDMCRAIGISSQNITNIKKSIPAADTAIKIADYLHVSVKWLITGEQDAELSQEERDLLDAFRMLGEQKDKDEIMGIINLKIEISKKGVIISNLENA